jgi:hypothetical protein
VDNVAPVISLGAAAFWISLAAVLIAGGYFSSRKEALKHETLLRLVERTGQLDEQQVKALFPSPAPLPPHWFAKPDPGKGRLGLQVFGTIVLALAIGLAVFFAIYVLLAQTGMREWVTLGFSWAGLVACIALGFLAAARFTPDKPAGRETDC